MVQQQRVGVRLIGRRGLLGQRRAEVAEARRSDDPEPWPGELRPPAVDVIDVGPQDPVGYQKPHALPLIGVLDGPETRLEPLGRERVEALPCPAHVFAIGGHPFPLPVSCCREYLAPSDGGRPRIRRPARGLVRRRATGAGRSPRRHARAPTRSASSSSTCHGCVVPPPKGSGRGRRGGGHQR
jgi:hypothetical protein